MERSAIGSIKEVIAYVETHLGDQLNLETVAAAAHYSKYHLCRMFADITGITLHDYIREGRFFMNSNVLDREWSAASLLRFAFPTVVMMVFMGLYTVVDTIFVARFVNTDALSAINIVCPVVNVAVGKGRYFGSAQDFS